MSVNVDNNEIQDNNSFQTLGNTYNAEKRENNSNITQMKNVPVSNYNNATQNINNAQNNLNQNQFIQKNSFNNNDFSNINFNQKINNIENQNNQKQSKKYVNKRNIIILIIFSILVLLSIFIILQKKHSSEDSYYSNSSYYITEEPQIIDNIDDDIYVEDTTANNTTTTHTTTANSTTTTHATTSNSTTNSNNIEKSIDRTIMIYIIGADLESEYGSATSDINEMPDANIDSYTNVYIYTGGTTSWKNSNFSNINNEIYKINGDKLERVELFGNLNMGLPDTLSNFINYVTDNSKTSEYDLILWDHGGGPIIGYGSDEKFNGDGLVLPELYSALSKTEFNENNKLEFIGFDACLMANVETAYVLKEYSNYLLASEETEPGSSWNYNALNNISKLNTQGFAKQIIDSYQTSIDEINSYYGYNLTYTLSLIDLSKIDDLVSEINTAFLDLNNKLDENFEEIAKMRSNSVEFGKSTADSSYDLIDLSSFVKDENDEYDFSNLSQDLNDVIIYSKSNIKNADGIAIYFPYTNVTYASKLFIPYYVQFTGIEAYGTFIENFNNIKTGVQRNDLNINSSKFKNNKLEFTLSESQIQNLYRVNYIVFEKSESDYYIPIYKSSKYSISKNKITMEYNKKKLVVKDKNGYETVNLMYVKNTNKGDLYYVPVALTSYSGNDMNSWKFDNGYVQLYIKNDKINEEGIIPINTDISSNNTNKIRWNFKDYDSASFTNFRYKILDENGNYTSQWVSDTTKYLYETNPNKNKVSFEFKNIDSNKEYFAVINVLDIQGNTYSSDLIKIN